MERRELCNGYLDALGFDAQAPSLTSLVQIARRHVGRFAFASLGPRLGDDLPLEPAALYERIVRRRRGGYCFEHNGLLYEVLLELGFEVRFHLARVIYNQDIHPGLTHRTSIVTIEGADHLVDVGFGSMGPWGVVPMSGEWVEHGHRSFRVAEREDGQFHLQTLKDGSAFSLYRFELVRYGQADCELGHFYSHRHPQAAFVNHLVASRILESEIRSLRNRDYRVIRGNEETVTLIENRDQLLDTLQGEFGLEVSAQEGQRLFDELP